MGKLQELSISFDNNKTLYSPGESISGMVMVKVNQPLQCKAIKVNCNGFCGITNKVNDMTWIMEEQYFNSSISVADKGTLRQGDHTFPFKFLLPATAPTSFEGNFGRIVYRVRAFIDTPKFSKDYSTEKAFYLHRLLNLNELPDIWGTSSSAVTQNFTYMLMKSGTIVLKAQTDMRGYTPGEIIQVTVSIENQSGKTTGNIAASLMQKVTYETKKPTYDLRTIAEVEGGVVKGGKQVEWKEQIIVPSLPQSSLLGCELIKIEYYIKVHLKSPDVILTLPVEIGNIALDKKRRSTRTSAPLPSGNASASVSAPDASTPPLPPRPGPKPAPRSRSSFHNAPTAPPVEYDTGAEGRASVSEDLANKRQSQMILPNAFSYAPGLLFPQNQQPAEPSAAPIGSAGATGLYPSLNGAISMPTALVPPPDYGCSSYPQEAPPTYDQSCNT